MTFPFRFFKDAEVIIDGRLAKFDRELPDGRAQFLDAESYQAINLTDDEFRDKYRDHLLEIIDAATLPSRFTDCVEPTLDHFPENARPDMRRRKEYLDAIDASAEIALNRVQVESIIKAVANQRKESPPHYKTVREWSKKRGSPGRRKLVEMRTRNDRKGGNSTLTSFQETKIRDAIETIYVSKRLLPPDDVYTEVVNAFTELNKTLPEQLWQKAPSKATVYRRVRKFRDYKTTRVRMGAKNANRIFRWVGMAPEPETINEIWVVDATILDNLVVLDDKNMVVLGKPTLTIIMDIYSRCVAGWYLGFEPPSHLSLGTCQRK